MSIKNKLAKILNLIYCLIFDLCSESLHFSKIKIKIKINREQLDSYGGF